MKRLNLGRYDYANFLTMFSFAASSLVIPVALVDISIDLGFSLADGGMAAGGILHLGRQASVVIAILLSGFMASQWGSRKSLGGALVLMSAGLLLCATSPSYGLLVMALVVAGLGEGVIEALVTPHTQELHPESSGRYINLTQSFWSVGLFITVLGTGLLVSKGLSWRVPVLAIAAISLVASAMLIISSKPNKNDQKNVEKSGWRETVAKYKQAVAFPRFWTFVVAMFFAGGVEYCITFWVASFIQLSLGKSVWIAGLGTAVFALAMFFGRAFWGIVIKQHQLKNLVLYSALAGVVISLFLPSQENLWIMFGLLFLTGLAVAPLWPSIQSYGVEVMPELDSTSLFILFSSAGIPGAGVFPLLMGFVGDFTGDLRMAFYLAPVCFGFIALMLAWDAYKARQSSMDLHLSASQI